MIEEGIVAKKRGKTVYVKLEKKPQCGACGACGFGKNNFVTLPAFCSIECEVGDKVKLQMPQKSFRLAAIILYALPLFVMVIGAFVGGIISELMAVICAFGFLVLSLFSVYLLDRFLFRKKQSYNPTIIERLEK